MEVREGNFGLLGHNQCQWWISIKTSILQPTRTLPFRNKTGLIMIFKQALGHLQNICRVNHVKNYFIYLVAFVIIWGVQAGNSAENVAINQKILKAEISEYKNYSNVKLRWLASKDDVAALIEQANRLYSQYNKNAYKKAFDIYMALAKRGYVDAQYDTASAYWYGNGVMQSQNTAIEWWKKSLRGGYALTASIWENRYDPQSANYKDDGTLLQPDISVQPNTEKSYMWGWIEVEMSTGSYKNVIQQSLIRKYKGMPVSLQKKTIQIAKRCMQSDFEKCGWPRR